MNWMLRVNRCARRLIALLVLGLVVVATPAAAQQFVDSEALDTLFADLRTAPDAATAQRTGASGPSGWRRPTRNLRAA